jgi:hypothetical protein
MPQNPPKESNNPIVIMQASKQPYLSIGVRFGGVTVNGVKYIYLPPHDAYLDMKYVKMHNKFLKENKTWEDFIEHIKSI